MQLLHRCDVQYNGVANWIDHRFIPTKLQPTSLKINKIATIYPSTFCPGLPPARLSQISFPITTKNLTPTLTLIPTLQPKTHYGSVWFDRQQFRYSHVAKFEKYKIKLLQLSCSGKAKKWGCDYSAVGARSCFEFNCKKMQLLRPFERCVQYCVGFMQSRNQW